MQSFIPVYYTILSIGTQARENSVNLDQIPQDVASNQCLHCLPLIEQFLDTSVCCEIVLLIFKGKYGKELSFPNISVNMVCFMVTFNPCPAE